MGSDGVREKDGAPLTIRALYVVEIENSALSMELAMAQWQELGVDVQLQGVDQAQFNTIAFETRAWDVFLAALNLDVPSLAVPFVSGTQPPDGVNFSAVANPEYDALVAEASALTGAEACEVWNAAEAELYAQMNILPSPRPRCRSSATAPSSHSDASGSSPTACVSWRPSSSPSGQRESRRPPAINAVTVGTPRTAWGSRHPWPAFIIRASARLLASLFLLITVSFAMIHAIPGRSRADRPRRDHRPARVGRGAAPRPRARPAVGRAVRRVRRRTP